MEKNVGIRTRDSNVMRKKVSRAANEVLTVFESLVTFKLHAP